MKNSRKNHIEKKFIDSKIDASPFIMTNNYEKYIGNQRYWVLVYLFWALLFILMTVNYVVVLR